MIKHTSYVTKSNFIFPSECTCNFSVDKIKERGQNFTINNFFIHNLYKHPFFTPAFVSNTHRHPYNSHTFLDHAPHPYIQIRPFFFTLFFSHSLWDKWYRVSLFIEKKKRKSYSSWSRIFYMGRRKTLFFTWFSVWGYLR